MAKRVKSVAFNTSNPSDMAMLKAVSRKNFSGYVKKLIVEDMYEKEQEKARKSLRETRPMPESSSAAPAKSESSSHRYQKDFSRMSSSEKAAELKRVGPKVFIPRNG